MKRSSIELDDIFYEKYKKSGISMKKLVEFGLKWLENNKENTEDLKMVEENILKFGAEIKRLRAENLSLSAKISLFNKEKLEKVCSETMKTAELEVQNGS